MCSFVKYYGIDNRKLIIRSINAACDCGMNYFRETTISIGVNTGGVVAPCEVYAVINFFPAQIKSAIEIQ